jgi:GT2 family glycosyltransferase
MNRRPSISIVLCTFNRARQLAAAIDALATQAPGAPAHDIIIVDNNSTDGTRDLVHELASRLPNLHYRFERAQGLATARNAGIRAAAAPLIAFTDDDVRVTPTWVETLVSAFDRHPDADWVGGKVLPRWPQPPPDWLDASRWAPLALVDHGDVEFAVTPRRRVCLIGANLAIRRRAFQRVGRFSAHTERRLNSIGSTEDHELQTRFWNRGLHGVYVPEAVVIADVQRERLDKRYHRAWHAGHGRFYAEMREPTFEASRMGTVLGVPAHVYRAGLAELASWLVNTVRGRSAAAFAHELRLRFLASFTRGRVFGAQP